MQILTTEAVSLLSFELQTFDLEHNTYYKIATKCMNHVFSWTFGVQKWRRYLLSSFKIK